jgi:hypothetical protein
MVAGSQARAPDRVTILSLRAALPSVGEAISLVTENDLVFLPDVTITIP